jgi:hypothetical protein
MLETSFDNLPPPVNDKVRGRFMNDKVTGRFTYKVNEEREFELDRIALKHRRKRSEVARFLLERGLIAYGRDGLLFEPIPDEKGAGPAPKKRAM